MDERSYEAAEDWLARISGHRKPNGYRDQDGVWQADLSECAYCCRHVHQSKEHPDAWLKHCKTANHLANLHSTDPHEMMQHVRALLILKEMK